MADLPAFDPSKPFSVVGASSDLPPFDPGKPYETAAALPVAGPKERDSSRNQLTDGFFSSFGRGVSEGWGSKMPGEETMESLGIFNRPGQPASPMQNINRMLIAPPATALRALGALTRGGQEALTSTGSLGRDIAAMPEAFQGMPGSFRAPIPSAPENMVTKGALKTEEQARDAVSRAFARGTAGGAPTAGDVISEMRRAREAGQPMTLADVNNTELGALIGTTYRQGGAARSAIKSFLSERSAEAGNRVQGLINQHLSDGSLRDTAQKLIADRSAHARPIWDEVRRGGSIAPLESQFETAFNAASRAEWEAAQRVAQANQKVTGATGKQAVSWNVYSTSAANRAGRTAAQELQQATAALEKARADKEAIRDRLLQAQSDRTSEAPGAIWSPRLQELLDQPEVKAGIRRGWNIERRNAVGRGEQFNPSEYAVIGEENGEPIVGKVPNMALLMVAKEGLDAIIESPAMKNPLTGRPTKAGLSYINLRDGLVSELDHLNPLYKGAREQWSGDTASIQALDDGRHFMDKRRFSIEELPAHFAGLTDSDKQFFVLGVADALKEKLFGTADLSNKGAAIINTESARRRIRPLFGSDEEAELFIDSIERERLMGQTPGRIYGGSATAGRVADDKTAEALINAAHGIGHLLSGNFIGGIASGLRVRRLFGRKPNADLSEAIARLSVDPNVLLSEVGQLVPKAPRPEMRSSGLDAAMRGVAASLPTSLVGSTVAERDAR